MREATQKDIPVIVGMARAVHEQSIFGAIMPFVPEHAEESLRRMLDEPEHVFLVMGDPPVAACVVRFKAFIANHDCTGAMEIFWYVNPEHRGMGVKFAKSVEYWLKERGVHVFDMSFATGMDPRLAFLYDRMGYTPTEFHFSKVL